MTPIASAPTAPADASPSPLRVNLRRRRLHHLLTLLALTCVLGALVVVSAGTGMVSVPPETTARVVAHKLLPGLVEPTWTAVEAQIVWEYRLPRTLLAAIVGAGLALVGTTLQAVVRNPLADPWVLGVSSGAGLGAVASLVVAGAWFAVVPLPVAAFMGATCATALLFGLARRQGRLTPLRLVLSGVALSYLFSAATNYLVLTTDAERVFGVLFFLLGSVASAGWNDLAVPLAVVLAGLVHLTARVRALNALLAGDEAATSLGIHLDRLRGELLLLTSLMTGVMVAVSGGIGFVGLVIPHLSRLFVGADHRRLIPVAALVGAIFLVLVDLVARTVAAPVELPIGVVTAAIGAPFFLWLMRRRNAERKGGLSR